MRLVATFLFLLAACGGDAEEAAAGPPKGGGPVPVRVEQLAPATLEKALEASGTIEAVNSADIRPEVQGLVEAVQFTDGQAVKRGDVLVRLRAAEAQAALLDAQSRATLATADLGRTKTLFERGDAAQAELDAAVANEGLAQAALRRSQEAIRRTRIMAPFDGVVGRREISPGELIDPSRTITHIVGLDSLVVDLVLAETALGEVAVGQPAVVRVDALPGQEFPATVSFVASQVREDTRTVDVRLALSSGSSQLRPGLTAAARVLTAPATPALLVPTQALVRSEGGPAVYVVALDNKVELRPVRTGQRTADRVEILEGVAAGDAVVVEGLARLRPGAAVEVRAPEGAAAADAAPAAPEAAPPGAPAAAAGGAEKR